MGKKEKRMALVIGGVMLVLVALLLWLVAMPSPAQQASVNGSNTSSAKDDARTHNAKKSSEGDSAASSSPAATHGDRGLDDHLEVDEGGLLQKAVFDYMSQHGHSDWKLSDIAITQEIKKYWGGYAGAHSEQYPA
ncbi:hypothetical protein, partial [Schleiferilactobacillus shenzhenensis]|uniref:hypothetical protein n=1 Tax=Schleiferilactobacillus shenzhenensis TaxID=1231337 RepID=UPI0018CAF32C